MRKYKTLGGAIDALFKARELRLQEQRAIDATKKKTEVPLKVDILSKLKEGRLERASGKLATGSRTLKPVGKITNFVAFLTWCVEHDASDLIPTRVNGRALQERFENGDRVPGVELEFITDLSLTKLSR